MYFPSLIITRSNMSLPLSDNKACRYFSSLINTKEITQLAEGPLSFCHTWHGIWGGLSLIQTSQPMQTVSCNTYVSVHPHQDSKQKFYSISFRNLLFKIKCKYFSLLYHLTWEKNFQLESKCNRHFRAKKITTT